MKYVYPAVFTQEGTKYLVSVPDLQGCHTFGDTLIEAIDMARDAMSMWLCESEDKKESIPTPSSINDLDISEGFANYIDVDTTFKSTLPVKGVTANINRY